MKKTPISSAIVAAVLSAFAALYLSTESSFVLILPLFFLASFLLPYRFERDANGIWGLRLLIYLGFAVLGRTPTGTPNYFVDSQAFTTAGLIAGGELCLQAFRRPPPGARFEPLIVSLSGVVFLIACNTYRFHIWVLAPLYILFMLLSLVDLRPRAARNGYFGSVRRVATILVAVALGGALHGSLWANRGSILAVGTQLLAATPLSQQGAQPGDRPQLTNTFGGNTSTTRLLRIEGKLNSGHLRTASFDRYSNGNWGPPISRRAPFQDALPDQTGEEDAQKQTIPRGVNDAKVTLLRDTGGTLFAPLNARAIMPDIGQAFVWDRFQGPLKIEEPAPLVYYFTNSKTSSYGWETEQGPLCVMPTAAQRRRLMTVPPEIDPAVSALAREVAQTGRTQSEKAAQIIAYLLQSNAYSLTFVRGKEDPVSDFVLNKRAAHCQYFASASVMMLRAVGIPARYATGYYAEERDEKGALLVRGRDAHAWTEAYLGDGTTLENTDGLYSPVEIAAAEIGPDGVPDIGWVSLDATPPTGRADPAVNPTPFYQPTLERAEDWFARVRAWFGQLTQLQIGGIMLIFVALWGLERARQGFLARRRRVPGQTPPTALAPLARRFERVLQKRGVTLAQGRPWSESVPETWPNEREWVDDYNRARFAESDAAADAEKLRALERELELLEK